MGLEVIITKVATANTGRTVTVDFIAEDIVESLDFGFGDGQEGAHFVVRKDSVSAIAL
jgi:hypothetical protein